MIWVPGRWNLSHRHRVDEVISGADFSPAGLDLEGQEDDEEDEDSEADGDHDSQVTMLLNLFFFVTGNGAK
jgi:hypothetical protein